jgi:hypothetical protein
MLRHKSNHSNSHFLKSNLLTAEFFLCFSNSTALMIWNAIRKKESTSQDISQRIGIAHKSVLSKLKKMEQEGILSSYDRNGTIFYQVADPKIISAFDQILAFPNRTLKEASAPNKGTRTDRPRNNRSLRNDSVEPVHQ